MHVQEMWYCFIVESAFNLFMHIICLLLLGHVYFSKRLKKTQLVFLINLSASDGIGNLCNLIYTLLRLYTKSELAHCVYRIVLYPYTTTFIAGLFLITSDRLAASLLKLRYKSICTVSRAKKIVLIIWCLSALGIPCAFAIIFACKGYTAMKKALDITHDFVIPIMFALASLFITISYIIIFVQYVKSRRRSTSTNHSIVYLFLNSTFSQAVILTAVQVIFVATPMIITFTMNVEHIQRTYHILFFGLLPNFTGTLDPIIYVFLYAPVRQVLTNKTLQWISNARSVTRTELSVVSPGNSSHALRTIASALPTTLHVVEDSFKDKLQGENITASAMPTARNLAIDDAFRDTDQNENITASSSF